MKIKINKSFYDKYTSELYVIGDEIEMDNDRATELLSDERGLVSLIEEVKEKSKKVKK